MGKKPHKYKTKQFDIDGYEPIGERVICNKGLTEKNPFLENDKENERNQSSKIYEDIEAPGIKAELNPFIGSESTPQYAVVDKGNTRKRKKEKEEANMKKEEFLKEQSILREQYVKQEQEKKAASRGGSTERGRSATPSKLPRCVSPDISQSELRRRYEEQQIEEKCKEKDERRMKNEQKERVKKEQRIEQQRLREQYEQQKKLNKSRSRGPSRERNIVGTSNTNGSVPSRRNEENNGSNNLSEERINKDNTSNNTTEEADERAKNKIEKLARKEERKRMDIEFKEHQAK